MTLLCDEYEEFEETSLLMNLSIFCELVGNFLPLLALLVLFHNKNKC